MTITAQEELAAYIDHVHLTIDSKYIITGEPMLKWEVTLRHRGDPVLTCEYSAGIGHAPSYPARASYEECRTGFSAGFPKKPILPDIQDFIQSICLDASALGYGCFEDWARELGYDEDSRKAEKMYRQCLQHGIMLRACLGSEKFDHLCHLCSQL